MAGGSADWETLINHQSSLLTETKNLLGETKELVEKSEKMLEEVKIQSKHNKWVLAVAVLTLASSIIIPLIVDGYLTN